MAEEDLPLYVVYTTFLGGSPTYGSVALKDIDAIRSHIGKPLIIGKVFRNPKEAQAYADNHNG